MTNISSKTINVHQLKSNLANNLNPKLIDVRETEEWNSGRLPNAIHIPKSDISSKISQYVLPEEPIYLYCRSGFRSFHAAQELVNLGYTEVYNVEGGILDWSSAGYPLVL